MPFYLTKGISDPQIIYTQTIYNPKEKYQCQTITLRLL